MRSNPQASLENKKQAIVSRIKRTNPPNVADTRINGRVYLEGEVLIMNGY